MKDFQTLLRETLGGNKKSFDDVVRRFQGSALALAARRLSDATLAQDAVQEAFLRAYVKLPDLKDLDSFPAWFRAILRSVCSRMLNRERRMTLVSDPDPAGEVPSDDLGPFEHHARYQSGAMVAALLDSLSGRTREACIERFVHGRSYGEIAGMLNVPLGTVKRRIHDARDKIVKQFERMEKDSIRVGYLPISDHLLAMVAHYFHDQARFQIKARRFLSWPSLVRSLVTGGLDAAFVMAPLAMHLQSRGVPLLYVLDGHHDGSAITVRKDGSTGNGSAKPRMGLPYMISTHRAILKSLLGQDRNGRAWDASARYMSPSYLIGSLKKNEIDAFFCAEPWSTRSVAEGQGKILARSGDLSPGHICCVLTVRQDYASKNGEVLRSYLKGLTSAGKYIEKNPGKSATIQARYTGVDPHVAEQVLVNRHVTFQDLTPDKGRFESAVRMAVRTGAVNPDALAGFFCTSYL